MNLDLGKFLKRLDYVCFVFAVVAAIPLILFEFTTIKYFFTISMIFFVITFVLLSVVIVLRFRACKMYPDDKDFSLRTIEKVRYWIFLVMSIICSIWFTYILICL